MAAAVDPSSVRSKADFVTALNMLKDSAGLSSAEIGRRAKAMSKDDNSLPPLPKSTLSAMFTGSNLPRTENLTMVLTICRVSKPHQAPWIRALEVARNAQLSGPAGAIRVDSASPRDLGVRAAIVTPDTTDEVPLYVNRTIDRRLLEALTDNDGRGCFLLVYGPPCAGKTRTLFETVQAALPGRWLVQPPSTSAISHLAQAPPAQTVVWLDNLLPYLAPDDRLRKTVVQLLTLSGVAVVATLTATEFNQRSLPGHPDEELLAYARSFEVHSELDAEELKLARLRAQEDSRIRKALDLVDSTMTRVLASGPALVRWWDHAEEPTKSLISAAVDAKRLGLYGPLSPSMLTEAMAGYLPDAYRVNPPSTWLEDALPNATTLLHGSVSALSPTDGGNPGSTAGYIVADYLVHHANDKHRTSCPPDLAWQAFIRHVTDISDVLRLAESARSRMRHCYLEPLLRKLIETRVDSALELARLLFAQDRIAEAIALLHDALMRADDSAAKVLNDHLTALITASEGVRQLRIAGSEADISELLADAGRTEHLILRADAGDEAAQDQLAQHLFERGRTDLLELRASKGEQFAAHRLADLLVATNHIDQLRIRARNGCDSAAHRLARYLAETGQIEELKRLAGTGERFAKQMLDDPPKPRAVESHKPISEDEAKSEVDAGTPGAIKRLLAIMAANGKDVSHLRRSGLPGTTAYHPGTGRTT